MHFYAMQFIDGVTLADVIAEIGLSVGNALRGVPLATESAENPKSKIQNLKSPASDTKPIADLLTDRLQARGRQLYRRAAELIANAADALEHAHSLGIVHRDIKPGNLLLDQTGKILVGDFGLARFGPGAGLTMSGDLLGTLRYMAPEQALARHGLVDHRADIYSLGCTLYELITLHPAVPASERAEILRQIAFDEPTALRKLEKAIPSELETITHKCLAKTPTERYATAGELAGDLRRWLDDKPIKAKPPSLLHRTAKWTQRHQSLMLAVLAALLLGTTVSIWQAIRATTAEAHATTQRDEAQKQRDEVTAVNEKLEATQAELRETLYSAHINLAHNAWKSNNLGGMRILLNRCIPEPGEPDLRGFEWHYLQRLSHPELLTITRHPNRIHSVAYSPNGKLLASASQGEVVNVWDSRTGNVLLSLNSGSTDPRFHPDGRLVTEDIESARHRVETVVFSPDGKHLASGRKVWDAQTGQELLTIQGHGWIRSFSPDGKRLAGNGYRGAPGTWASHVIVWDAQTGAELMSLQGHIVTPRGQTDHIDGVVFSPDGKRIASASHDHTAKVWDAQSGEDLLTYKVHEAWVKSVTFSPDGKYLATTSGDASVQVWDAATGETLHVLRGHLNGVDGVAFSPSGERLASASLDGLIKVWDVHTGTELLSHRGHSGQVHCIAFSPDGKYLVSGAQDDTIRVWDAHVASGAPISVKGGANRVWGVEFSPDGRRIASAGSAQDPANQVLVGLQVKIWDAQTAPGSETGKDLLVLAGHTADVWSVAYSPDGKRLASASADTTIKIWDAESGDELQTLSGHSGAVRTVVFSSDGRHVASASTDKTVKVWDLKTGQARLTLPGTGTSAMWMATKGLAFSPDGKRLAAGSDRTVKIWDVETGQELATINEIQPRALLGLTFSPDGRYLAFTGMSRHIRIWDTQTAQDFQELVGHSEGIYGLAYSRDGRRLASAAQDGVKIWNPHSGQELLTLTGHTARVCLVAFSPDGHRLATNDTGGTVRIWDATPLAQATETKP